MNSEMIQPVPEAIVEMASTPVVDAIGSSNVAVPTEPVTSQTSQNPNGFRNVLNMGRNAFAPRLRRAGIAGAGALMTLAAACGGGEGDDPSAVVGNVEASPTAGRTVIDVVLTPTPTKEVPPTPTKTAKEIAFETMPEPIKAVYHEIEGLNETVFKGTDVTPDVVEKALLQPIIEIQAVTSTNPAFEASGDFAGYINLLGVLQAQYNAKNRSPEIRHAAQSIVSFLRETYPDRYNRVVGNGGIMPDFIPSEVK